MSKSKPPRRAGASDPRDKPRGREEGSPILSKLPLTAAVEEEIRYHSRRVRILRELLNACQMADRHGRIATPAADLPQQE